MVASENLAIDGTLIDGDHVLGGSEAVKKWQDETIALEEQLKLLHEEQLCSTTAHWNFLDGLSAGVRGLKENAHICFTADPAAMKRYALEALEYEVTRLSDMATTCLEVISFSRIEPNNMMVILVACTLGHQPILAARAHRPRPT